MLRTPILRKSKWCYCSSYNTYKQKMCKYSLQIFTHYLCEAFNSKLKLFSLQIRAFFQQAATH